MENQNKAFEAFEADAAPYGYDLTVGNDMLQFTRGEVPFVYQDEATNHRWLGFLAAYELFKGDNND